MPSLTETVQTNIRALTGTSGMYWEDWHALCDLAGIAKGQINERLLAYYKSFNTGALTFSAASNYFLLNPLTVTNGTVLGLFSAGQQGAWYDPSDFTTLFQDSAGTTPVTAVTQPVGLMLDKSGRGKHAIQATAGNRPTLQIDGNGNYYLAFNGTSTSMSTTGLAFSQTPHIVLAGIVPNANSDVIGTGAPTTGNALLMIFASKVRAHMWATTLAVIDSAASFTLGSPYVIGQVFDGTNLSAKLNGVATSTGNGGAAVTASTTLILGSRDGVSNFFNGRLYSLIVRAAASTAAEISSTERYIANKTGVTLP